MDIDVTEPLSHQMVLLHELYVSINAELAGVRALKIYMQYYM